MAPFRGRVIIGVSDSVCGLRALRLAVSEARRRDRTLHAVRCWTRQQAAGLSPIPLADGRAEWGSWLVRHVFDDIGGVPTDLTVVMATVEGAPGPTLVRYADRDDDLLVVGEPQRRLRPSVARYCVAHASCPVLAVPPDRLARDQRRLSQSLRRDLAALERGRD
jgi:nucleotide-binding universal stress UspA family protein